jgi:predicted nucleic acid-binding protein
MADASVILKWALPSDDEPDADKALILRNAIRDDLVRAIVPAWWVFEVGNTIARRFPEEADTWLAALLKFGLEELPTSPRWLAQTLELSRRYAVSFYDAAYHATALVQDGVFVTADTRYVSLASPHGGVIPLHEWIPPKQTGPARRR